MDGRTSAPGPGPTLCQSDPPTPNRTKTHSGLGIEQEAVEHHSGPVQGDAEETRLHGQQTRQKEAAEMLEVALDSFKVWLLGPPEAHWHRMSLGSKRHPEVYTEKTLIL